MKYVITINAQQKLKPMTRSHLAALIANPNNKYELEEIDD